MEAGNSLAHLRRVTFHTITKEHSIISHLLLICILEHFCFEQIFIYFLEYNCFRNFHRTFFFW